MGDTYAFPSGQIACECGRILQVCPVSLSSSIKPEQTTVDKYVSDTPESGLQNPSRQLRSENNQIMESDLVCVPILESAGAKDSLESPGTKYEMDECFRVLPAREQKREKAFAEEHVVGSEEEDNIQITSILPSAGDQGFESEEDNSKQPFWKPAEENVKDEQVIKTDDEDFFSFEVMNDRFENTTIKGQMTGALLSDLDCTQGERAWSDCLLREDDISGFCDTAMVPDIDQETAACLIEEETYKEDIQKLGQKEGATLHTPTAAPTEEQRLNHFSFFQVKTPFCPESPENCKCHKEELRQLEEEKEKDGTDTTGTPATVSYKEQVHKSPSFSQIPNYSFSEIPDQFVTDEKVQGQLQGEEEEDGKITEDTFPIFRKGKISANSGSLPVVTHSHLFYQAESDSCKEEYQQQAEKEEDVLRDAPNDFLQENHEVTSNNAVMDESHREELKQKKEEKEEDMAMEDSAMPCSNEEQVPSITNPAQLLTHSCFAIDDIHKSNQKQQEVEREDDFMAVQHSSAEFTKEEAPTSSLILTYFCHVNPVMDKSSNEKLKQQDKVKDATGTKETSTTTAVLGHQSIAVEVPSCHLFSNMSANQHRDSSITVSDKPASLAGPDSTALLSASLDTALTDLPSQQQLSCVGATSSSSLDLPSFDTRGLESTFSAGKTSSESELLDDEYMNQLLGKLDSPEWDFWLQKKGSSKGKESCEETDFSCRIQEVKSGSISEENGDSQQIEDDVPEEEKCSSVFASSDVTSIMGESIFDDALCEGGLVEDVVNADDKYSPSLYVSPVMGSAGLSEVSGSDRANFSLAVSGQIINKDHQKVLDILNLTQEPGCLTHPIDLDMNTAPADAERKTCEYVQYIANTQRYQYLSNRPHDLQEHEETCCTPPSQSDTVVGDRNALMLVPDTMGENEDKNSSKSLSFASMERESHPLSDSETDTFATPCYTTLGENRSGPSFSHGESQGNLEASDHGFPTSFDSASSDAYDQIAKDTNSESEVMDDGPLSGDFSLMKHDSGDGEKDSSFSAGRRYYEQTGFPESKVPSCGSIENNAASCGIVDKSSMYSKSSFLEYRSPAIGKDEDEEESDNSSDQDSGGEHERFSTQHASHQYDLESPKHETSFRPVPAPRHKLVKSGSLAEVIPATTPDRGSFPSCQFTSDPPQHPGSHCPSSSELARAGVQQMGIPDFGWPVETSGDKKSQAAQARHAINISMTETGLPSEKSGINQTHLTPETELNTSLLDKVSSDLKPQERYGKDVCWSNMQQTQIYPSRQNLQSEDGDEREVKKGEKERPAEECEEQRTVEVTGFNAEDEEICRLYFENSKRSGGGEIEEDGVVWDESKQCFLVTFLDSRAAGKVCSKKHILKQRTVHVQLHTPPECYNDRMLVGGVPEGITKDCLQNYLECVADISVTRVEFNSCGEAEVLMDPGCVIDLRQIQRVCQESPLDEQTKMTFRSIPVVKFDTVFVKHLKASTTDDCIKMFFQNKKRNAGGPITAVQRLTGSKALVHFEKHEDAESVVRKPNHVLDGQQLQLDLYRASSSEKSTESEVHLTESMEVDDVPETLLSDSVFENASRNCPEEKQDWQEQQERKYLPHALKSSTERDDTLEELRVSETHITDKAHDTKWHENTCSAKRLFSDDSMDTSGREQHATSTQGNQLSAELQPSSYPEQMSNTYSSAHDPKTRASPIKQSNPGHTTASSVSGYNSNVDPSMTYNQYRDKNSNKRESPPGRGRGYYFRGSSSQYETKRSHGTAPENRCTTYRLGADVIQKIKDKDLKHFVTFLKQNVNGRFQWKPPDSVEVICLYPNAPDDWEVEVQKNLDKYTHPFRVALGKGMGLKHPSGTPDRKSAMETTGTGCKHTEEAAARYSVPVGKPQNLQQAEVTIDLKPYQRKYLSIPQAFEKAKAVFPQGDFHFDNTGLLRIILPAELKTKVKSEVLSLLTSLVETSIPVSGILHQMFMSPVNQKMAQELLNRRGIICHWQPQGNNISVTAHKEDVQGLEKFFISLFTESKLPIGEAEESVIRSHLWMEFMEHIQQREEGYPDPVLLPDLSSKVLLVCDTPANIGKTRAAVMSFFDGNRPEEKMYKFCFNHLFFLSKFCPAELTDLRGRGREVGVSFTINKEGLTVKGLRDGIAKVVGHMKELISTIITDEMTFKTQGAAKYLKGSKGQEFLQSTGQVTNCLITLFDDLSSEDGAAGPFGRILAQFTCSRGKIVIAEGNITECQVGAIVNAANGNLEHGGGVALAIVKAGGDSIQVESRKIVDRQGTLKEGEVVATGSGRLPCSHILHAVGPTWRDGLYEEDKILKKTVMETLKLAQKLGVSSVAMPALSCGIFKYPTQEATAHILRCVDHFFRKQEYQGCLDTVVLIDITPEPLTGFLGAAKIIFDEGLQVLGKPTGHTHKEPSKSPKHSDHDDYQSHSGHSRHSSDQKSDLPVNIIAGEIAKSRADVIVSTIHPSLDLRKGVLSKSILEEGGETIQQELQNYSQKYGKARLGGIVKTRGGKLKCRSVFHLTLPTWHDDAGETMCSAVKKCLDMAKKDGAKSIAFPSLGSGKLGYPGDEVASIMFGVFQEWFRENRQGLREVQIIVYPKDRDTLEAFKKKDRKEGHAYGHRQGHQGRHRVTSDAPSSTKTRIGPITVMVKQGNILTEPCDAIVNSSNNSLDLKKGAVSKSILDACGNDIIVECVKQRNEMEENGVAATSVESGLACATIIHVSADRFKGEWQRGTLQALRLAEKMRLRSVAFPALGTSMRGADPEDLAQGMKNAVSEFSKRARSVKEVRVIVFQQEMLTHYVGAFNSDESPRRAKPAAAAAASESNSYEDMDHTEKKTETINITIYSNKPENIKTAKTKIYHHMKDNIVVREVEDSLITSFRAEQQSAVQRLETKHDVEIKLKVNDGKVKVKGFEKDVMEAISDIKDILLKATIQRLRAAGMPPVRWQYEVGKDKFHDFDPENVITIEAAYKNKEGKVDFKDKRGRCYTIVFKDMKEYLHGDRSVPPVKIRRRDLLQERSHEIPLPSHWEPMKGEKVKLVDLNPNSLEYKRVVQHFGAQASIKKIQRVQNPTLFQQYKAKKKELEQFNPKGTENEKRLWHGTSSDVVKSIITNGFNRSYCGKNGTALGAGVYFAANSATSMGYARGGNMFQARVLTGEHTPGNSGMRMAPAKPSGDRPYDSVSDGGNPPGVHVIFHDSQAYPEYLLTL